MLSNGNLARSISEQTWDKLITLLNEKAESAGIKMVSKVNTRRTECVRVCGGKGAVTPLSTRTPEGPRRNAQVAGQQ